MTTTPDPVSSCNASKCVCVRKRQGSLKESPFRGNLFLKNLCIKLRILVWVGGGHFRTSLCLRNRETILKAYDGLEALLDQG